MPASKTKQPYHHGDLRHALLEAAWTLIEREGMAALTLRQVARQVGVTHAAPYHHFPTRDALLDTLAEQAFRELERAEADAVASVSARSSASARMFALGRAYIDFAHAAPERLQ